MMRNALRLQGSFDEILDPSGFVMFIVWVQSGIGTVQA